MNWRSVVSLLVCAGAIGGAMWLARFDAGVADAPAQVVPQEYRVAAVETGRLVELHVTAGQRVRAGDLLARVDTSVIEREIAVAEARLRQFGAETSASAVELNAGGHLDERVFQRDVADAASELETAKAAFTAQQSELANMQTEIARQRKLVSEGLSRRDRADELELRSKGVAESVGQWPERIAGLVARHREAQQRLAKWQAEYKPTEASTIRAARLRPLEGRVAEQAQALQVLRTRLAAARLVAPGEAEVVSVLAQNGDVARAGEPIVILHSLATRTVIAYVSERDGGRVMSGSKAILRRRTESREELPSRVLRVEDTVIQLPQRFWVVQTLPQWGRQVQLEMPTSGLDAGEAIDVKFLGGGAQAGVGAVAAVAESRR